MSSISAEWKIDHILCLCDAQQPRTGGLKSAYGKPIRRLWLLFYIYPGWNRDLSVVASLRSYIRLSPSSSSTSLAYVDDDNDHTKRSGSTFCVSRDGFKLSPMPRHCTYDTRWLTRIYQRNIDHVEWCTTMGENEQGKRKRRKYKNEIRCGASADGV